MIESASQLVSKLVIQSASSPVSQWVIQSVSQSFSWSVSQSVAGRRRGGGEKGWGSVTQLVGHSSGKVVSIGVPVVLSICWLFFRNCQYPEILLANYNDYLPF